MVWSYHWFVSTNSFRLVDCKTVRIFVHSSTNEQVKQKVWSEAENRERDWGKMTKRPGVWGSRALRAWDSEGYSYSTLNRFWEKTDCFAVYRVSRGLFSLRRQLAGNTNWWENALLSARGTCSLAMHQLLDFLFLNQPNFTRRHQ